MTAAAAPRRWPSLPISVQILILLLGGLVAAQVVTLGLTLLLPPSPPQQHSLAEVAAALGGGPLGGGSRPLVRTVEAAPPSLQSPGWVVSERSTEDLASLLRARPSDVRLLFYAPPPLAGAGPPPPGLIAPALVRRPATFGFMLSPRAFGPASLAGFAPPGGGGGGAGGGGPSPMGMGMGGGGFGGPRGPWGGGGAFPPRPGGMGGGFPAPEPLRPKPSTAGPPSSGWSGAPPAAPQPAARDMARSVEAAPAEGVGPAGGGRTGPAAPVMSARLAGPALATAGAIMRPPLDAAVFAPQVMSLPPAAASPAQSGPTAAPPVGRGAVRPSALEPRIERSVAAPQPLAQPMLAAAPAAADREAPPQSDSFSDVARQPGRRLDPPASPGLFGLASAPYVEGDFVAALRVGPGRWVTVRPRPERFLNSWQRRILLWFALSFALVAPVGYLFARRLAAPLQHFAMAAEVLGRDPRAEVSAREGPAEVGRAARAFNLMQRRLKRYVEDRTGMMGAISHDLRTPLARMRFRLERASPELRSAMSRDIAQMEEMISSVLMFMRDEAVGGRRERVDLRSILEVVVDDAVSAGGEIELDPGAPIEVEVDLLGVQRVFENLVSNAIKYGQQARARLFARDGEAVVEIADSGPGIPEPELQSVFRPFYRTPEARASSHGGMGLGLAASRSTIRAHGGELSLANTGSGLVAQVRLPLAVRGVVRAAAA